MCLRALLAEAPQKTIAMCKYHAFKEATIRNCIVQAAHYAFKWDQKASLGEFCITAGVLQNC